MKKFLIIAFFYLLPVNEILAQENILFGLKGGASLSNFNREQPKNITRTGYYFGAFAEIPLSERFSLLPEILYATQGAETESPSFEGTIYNDYELNYLQVPVLIKMYVYKGLAIEAGPSFNFLVDENLTGRSAMFPDGYTNTENLGRRFEFGAALGVSYNLPGHFMVNSRFIHGLTDVFIEDYKYLGSTYNYGFQLGIGYLF